MEKINKSLEINNPQNPLYFSFLIIKTRTLISGVFDNGFPVKLDYGLYNRLKEGVHNFDGWQINKF